MQMRGLRFYIPDIDLLSDTHLVAGLTYEIKVPIYNASFKSTGNFHVKLSYANVSEFNFFVQLDPGNEDIKDEVHESRLNYNTGEIIDVGGNNEGYFAFNITSKNEVTKKHAKAAAIMAGEYKPEHSDGVICSAVFTGAQAAADSGKLKAAVETLDQTGTLSADVRLND